MRLRWVQGRRKGRFGFEEDLKGGKRSDLLERKRKTAVKHSDGRIRRREQRELV